MGVVWLARAHTVYLCMRFVWQASEYVIFFVDRFKNARCSRGPLRACGGKVGAGTVEAEEDTSMGGVDLFSLLRGQTPRVDRQRDKEGGALCVLWEMVLSSALGWRDV